jgi:hypothetical protein
MIKPQNSENEKPVEEINNPGRTQGYSSVIVGLLLSILSSLYLVPSITGILLAGTVALFSFKILETTDFKNNLAIDFSRKGMEGESKISGDFVGATAMFVLILAISIPALYYDKNIKTKDDLNKAKLAQEKERLAQEKEIENRKIAVERERLGLAPTNDLSLLLKTDGKVGDDLPDYTYVRSPFLSSENKEDAIRRLDLVNALKKIGSLNLFDPILVSIRNDCKEGLGVCVIPIHWFPATTKIQKDVPSIGNQETTKNLPVRKVLVCKGHQYLAGSRINFSINKNINESDEKDTDNSSPYKREPLPGMNTKYLNEPVDQINEEMSFKVSRNIDNTCVSSDEYPTFVISNELQQAMGKLRQKSKDKRVYVRIVSLTEKNLELDN